MTNARIRTRATQTPTTRMQTSTSGKIFKSAINHFESQNFFCVSVQNQRSFEISSLGKKDLNGRQFEALGLHSFQFGCFSEKKKPNRGGLRQPSRRRSRVSPSGRRSTLGWRRRTRWRRCRASSETIRLSGRCLRKLSLSRSSSVFCCSKNLSTRLHFKKKSIVRKRERGDREREREMW